MKNRLTLVLILCLMALMVGAPGASAATANERALAAMVNADRSANGRTRLLLDETLCSIARTKAEDMLRNGYFAHTSPTYGNIRTMLSGFGVSYASAAENIARCRTIEHAEASFLSSAGHRATLLRNSWTRMGIGVAITPQGFVYVSQVFVR